MSRNAFFYALGPLKCEGGRPYLLPLCLIGDIYLTFLQEILPELLEVVPLEIRREMRFQHDCALAYCTNVVHEYLNETFGNRWIGRGGPITCPFAPLT
jgi:hypothetical protein